MEKQAENDFKKWISWNVQNHKRYVSVRPSSVFLHGQRSLDSKLVKAEAAKVRYIVSQDGNGDFKSIREAIDSIPLHNTRRVILDIRPGMYRYIYTHMHSSPYNSVL